MRAHTHTHTHGDGYGILMIFINTLLAIVLQITMLHDKIGGVYSLSQSHAGDLLTSAIKVQISPAQNNLLRSGMC